MDFNSLAVIPWFAWIAIIGIIVGGIVSVSTMSNGRKSELAEALKQNAEINEKLVARLDNIDARLSAVEKTLNDIPE